MHGAWPSSENGKAARVTVAGIFAGNPPTLLVAMATKRPESQAGGFKTLSDPLLSPGGTVAFSATAQGAADQTRE
jgi:hypothetical protein